jgi:hypothetical protein
MATKVEVYPRPGETYPDAAGVTITSAGAIVWESKYIEDAIRDGFLLTYDPYGVRLPDDRTDTLPPAEGAPDNAPYIVAAPGTIELPAARVLAAGLGISVTDGGPGMAIVVAATGVSAPVDAQYLVSSAHPDLTSERVLTAGTGIALTPTAGALAVSSTVVAPVAPVAAPPNVAASSSPGSPGSYATAQHTHGHGDQAGGTLHALATVSVAGFLSSGDKVKINAIPLAGAAPADAQYLVSSASAGLSAERVLTAGAGISLTPGAGTLTVAASGPVSAPVDAEYLVGSSSAVLSNEKVLTAGPGIVLTPGGGTLTIESTATGGAPADAEYLVSSASAVLTSERVLTAGAGITLTPAAGTLTIASTVAGGVQGPASSTDNAVARWDGTTGQLVQSSLATLTDSGFLSVDNLSVAGDISVAGTVDGVDISNLAMALANVAVPSYVTLAATPTLGNERVLTAGVGIAITDGGAGGPVTIDATGGGGGGAPVDAEYLVSVAHGGLAAERVLQAGANITLTPGAGTLTIASTGGGGGGAPTDAEYLVSALSSGLSAERVLTAGVGVSLTPSAGALTIATVNAVQSVTLSTDNAVTRWDGTTGKVVQSSTATLDDAGLLSTAALSVAGDIAVSGTVDGVDIAGANFASYMTLGANTSLPNERTLLTTGGILVADGGPGASVTLSAPGLAAPFVTLASDLNLANERVLTAGAGITITDGGAGGAVTIASSVAGGAPTMAQYLTLAADPTLTAERVLTAGPGLAFTDSGPGGTLTIRNALTLNAQVNTSYTLVLSDAGKQVQMHSNVPVVLTIPADASVLFPDGTVVDVIGTNFGPVDIQGASGVTLLTATHQRFTTTTPDSLFLAGLYVRARLVKTSNNQWVVSGELAPYVETLAGTALTLAGRHVGNVLATTSAAATTLTIPLASTSIGPFPIGCSITIHQLGAGQVTVAAGAGATLNVPAGFAAKTRGQFSEVRLTQVSPNAWDITGHLEDTTSYLTLGASAALTNERVLTAGSGISFVDGGAGGALTVNATGGGGGAPTTAQYLTLATDATLTNERVLTAGAGISLTDGGAGGALTIANSTPLNAQVASYTLVLADAWKLVSINTAGASSLTVPSAANFPVGTVIHVAQQGTGKITITPSGVTLQVAAGKTLVTAGQFSKVTLTHIATNYWNVTGDLEENSANTPAFSAVVPGTQSIPAGGGGVQVLWNETNDPNNNFTANAYTAPRSGWYAIAVDINMGPATDASGLLRLRVNFGTYTNWPTVKVSGAGTSIIAQGTVMYFLNAGDFIDCTVIQNSAAACTLGTGTFSAARVG